MALTPAQAAALAHIKKAYVGPERDDEVLVNRPSLQYVVGMLFPTADEEPVTTERLSGDSPPDPDEFVEADVEEGDVEEEAPTLAEDWRPSSTAVSIVASGDSLLCDFSAATYSVINDSGPRRWRRAAFSFTDIELKRGEPPSQYDLCGVPVEIGSRWREYGDSSLVTVHLRLRSTSTGEDRADIDQMLFQVELAVRPIQDSRICEYDIARAIDVDAESRELRLRYRAKKLFGIGHGMAAAWDLDDRGECTRVYLESVPSFVVPAIEQAGGDKLSSVAARSLQLDFLEKIDRSPHEVIDALSAFVDAFSLWADDQTIEATSLGSTTAQEVAKRSSEAAERMRRGVELLAENDNEKLRKAFALAMSAMYLQMRQAELNRGTANPQPTWRPFQLGFILVSLCSATDDSNPERELVDLIWFPTGGGKTEAYLAIAALVIFLRRIRYGAKGAGTAVITRYTLRLLTAQQFQRAAALICAMEIMRRGDERVARMAPFSIGLWIGNDSTPSTTKRAREALERLYKARRPREANQFQITECPWCTEELIPEERGLEQLYGPRRDGNDVVFRCTSPQCAFEAVDLPLVVVDTELYDDPPTFLLATVDKFARLQFDDRAGRLLGIGTPYRPPSLVIQDELHLLSGPLGTTVAVFDAVIQLLLSREGSSPKIIASTATIRASREQVRNLYGRDVALYPPAGLDGDASFFAKPVDSGEGRLYAGVMPQSVPQQTALVPTTAPLLEIPSVVRGEERVGDRLDPYWTLVMYHNSLRELGRTSALLLDDVNARLRTRADRYGAEPRTVRAASVLELTSMRGAEELPQMLRQLRVGIDESSAAADVILSSNMLSVGIDVQRLALMMMVGQPKTAAEYIQATSRVGRGDVHGIVMTLFRSNRARDRSQFETFRGYHDALYRSVEPTSVTPWSLSSRDRSLAGAIVALVRHSLPALSRNEDAGAFDLSAPGFRELLYLVLDRFAELVRRADPSEADATAEQVNRLVREWDRWAANARAAGETLLYERKTPDSVALMKRAGDKGAGWLVGDSMRSVEPNVAVEVIEPRKDIQKEPSNG